MGEREEEVGQRKEPGSGQRVTKTGTGGTERKREEGGVTTGVGVGGRRTGLSGAVVADRR